MAKKQPNKLTKAEPLYALNRGEKMTDIRGNKKGVNTGVNVQGRREHVSPATVADYDLKVNARYAKQQAAVKNSKPAKKK